MIARIRLLGAILVLLAVSTPVHAADRELPGPGFSEPIERLVFSPDGDLLFGETAGGAFAVWDVAARHLLWRGRGRANGQDFVAGGRSLLIQAGDRSVDLVDARSGELLRRFETSADRVEWFAAGPGGGPVAVVGSSLAEGGNARLALTVWARGAESPVLDTVLPEIGSVVGAEASFSADGRFVLVKTFDADAYVFDLEAPGAEPRHLGRDEHGLVAFDRSGRRLLVQADWPVTSLRSISLAEPGPEATLATPFAHPEVLFPVADTDAYVVASATAVGFWRVGEEEAAPRLSVGFDAAHAISPDGRRVLVREGDTLRIAQYDGGVREEPLPPATSALSAAALAPRGPGMALATASGSILIRAPDGGGRAEEKETAPGGPRLVAQTGHTGAVVDAAVDDGRELLATLDDNGVALLWHRRSGRQLRRLRHGLADPELVAIAPDGCCTAVAARGGRIALLDSATGRLVRTQDLGADLRALAFTADGAGLIAAGGESWGSSRLVRWSMPDGAETTLDGTHLAGPAHVLAASDDGRLAVADRQGHVSVLDARAGELLWEATLAGDEAEVTGLAFASAEGLLVGREQGMAAELVRVGRSGETELVWSRPSAILGPSKMLRLVDGSWAFRLLSDWWHFDPDTGTARELTPRSFELEVLLTDQPDGGLIGVQGNGRVRCFRPGDDGTCFVMRGVSPPTSVTFSPDGRYLGFGYDAGGAETAATLWRLGDGRTLGRLTAPGEPGAGGSVQRQATHVDFTGDGLGALVKRRETLQRWQALGGDAEAVAAFERLANDRNNAPGLAAGRYAYCHEGTDVVVHGAGTATEQVRLEPDYAGAPPIPSCLHAAVTANGRWVVAATNAAGRLQAWRLGDGSEDGAARLLRRRGPTATVLRPVRDGADLLVAWSDGGLERLDVATGETVTEFAGDVAAVSAIEADAPTDRLVLGKRDGTIQLRRLSAGGGERVLDSGAGAVSALALAPDGDRLLSAHRTGVTILWDLAAGEELARLIRFPDGRWAAVAPDGRYDASNPGDLPGLHWVLPEAPFEPVPVERFYRDYYEPRLVPRLLAGERLEPIASPADINRVVPRVEILAVEREAPGRIAVELRVSGVERDGQASGAADLKLFRDGRLVAMAPGEGGDLLAGDGERSVRFEGIRLPRSRSTDASVEFSAYAFNAAGIKSSTARTVYRPPAPAGPAEREAFVVAIGINAHQNPAWDLRYAAADARTNAELLTSRIEGSGEFDAVHGVQLIADGPQRRVERADIEAVLGRLAGAAVDADRLADIPGAEGLSAASPDDLVYIAFSGHGYAGDDGRFHLFASDIGAPAGGGGRQVDARLLERSLDSDRLGRLMRGIDAGEMMLIVDACNAAASVEGAGFKPGPMGSRGLGQMAYDKAMRVLAASQAEAVALESDRLRHGALTYAMLREGLQGAAADRAPADRRVTFDEMLRYGVDRVPDLYRGIRSGGGFEPQGRSLAAPFSLDVEGDASAQDLASYSTVQQPSLFDFRRTTDGDVGLPVLD